MIHYIPTYVQCQALFINIFKLFFISNFVVKSIGINVSRLIFRGLKHNLWPHFFSTKNKKRPGN